MIKYCFVLLVSLTCSLRSQIAQNNYDLSNLYEKKEITVAITDSGLGGLAVMDDIAQKMKNAGCFRKVNLIFVNALFDPETGYNSLQNREEKINILNKVLNGIELNYHPDIILIACNTLSVIYKETEFYNNSRIPVFGIVDPGVELIKKTIEKDTASNVIIFGTETTIEENSHKKALLKMDISDDRIITEACPQLQSYIEQNPAGEETEMLISAYLNEALENVRNKDRKIYLSLNCSHYGYSERLWERAMQGLPYKFGGILNPNEIMGDVLISEKYRNRFADTKISFLVASKTKTLNKSAMFEIFRENDPGLAEALKNYIINPELFDY
jgi:glutamate racemase